MSPTDCGGQMYISDMGCYWKVVGPPGQQLKLETIFFDNGGDCSKGTINIYDGPNKYGYCNGHGADHPRCIL